MLFYIVKIVDALKRAGPPAYRLVEYQVQAPTSAAAKLNAIEHHLARTDRPGRAVRCVIVEPVAAELRTIQIWDAPITVDDIEKLEQIHRPYILA